MTDDRDRIDCVFYSDWRGESDPTLSKLAKSFSSQLTYEYTIFDLSAGYIYIVCCVRDRIPILMHAPNNGRLVIQEKACKALLSHVIMRAHHNYSSCLL